MPSPGPMWLDNGQPGPTWLVANEAKLATSAIVMQASMTDGVFFSTPLHEVDSVLVYNMGQECRLAVWLGRWVEGGDRRFLAGCLAPKLRHYL